MVCRWPLVDAGAAVLRPTDRAKPFADIAAGEYLGAVERIIRAVELRVCEFTT